MQIGASLVAQWLGICLPVQGTWVQALVWEDPTCRGATKPHAPRLLSLHSGARKPQLLSPRATTAEAHAPRAHALQQERPLQWEDRSLQLEKAHVQQRGPNAAKNK